MIPSRPTNESGFGLIEILVAAVVIGILTLSGFYFMSNQNKMGVAGNDLMKGINYGKLKMDSLKVTSYADLASGSDTVSDRYIRSWYISALRNPDGTLNGLKELGMTVTWPLTAVHSVSFSTLKSDDKYREPTP